MFCVKTLAEIMPTGLILRSIKKLLGPLETAAAQAVHALAERLEALDNLEREVLEEEGDLAGVHAAISLAFVQNILMELPILYLSRFVSETRACTYMGEKLFMVLMALGRLEGDLTAVAVERKLRGAVAAWYVLG